MAPSESRTAANELLVAAADRSKRVNVAYAAEFSRAMDFVSGGPTPTPPLARLIQGGRSNGTRLRLYLLLTMMATRAPFDIRRPPTPSALARTLDLSPATGARMINSNLKWLENHDFIRRTKRPGETSAIQLLDPTDPRHGPLPSQRREGLWTTIPLGFWRNGWILDLRPTTIAVLFALAERLGGQKVPLYLTRSRRDSYGLSHDTWTRGEKDLVERGLLEVSRVPQGNDFDYTRLRNAYWLEKGRLDLPRSLVGPPTDP